MAGTAARAAYCDVKHLARSDGDIRLGPGSKAAVGLRKSEATAMGTDRHQVKVEHLVGNLESFPGAGRPVRDGGGLRLPGTCKRNGEHGTNKRQPRRRRLAPDGSIDLLPPA
jgi:hypothetical protein